MSVDTSGATDEWDDLSYGDRLRYVGPDEVPGTYVTPSDRQQPYMFRVVSVGGTVRFDTRYGGEKILTPDHPCNDRDYWEVVTA